jgi:hypothetical protein
VVIVDQHGPLGSRPFEKSRTHGAIGFHPAGGSVDSVNPSTGCGLISNFRQIRPTVDLDSPDRAALDVRDHCVAFFGDSSSVATITSSTLSNRIEGGRPGRGSSIKPSTRDWTNRRRHVLTGFGTTPRSAATCLFVAPGAAHASTIRNRNAKACADSSPPRPPRQLLTLRVRKHPLE